MPFETYLPPTALLRFNETGSRLDPAAEMTPTLNEAGYQASPPDILIALDQVPHLFE